MRAVLLLAVLSAPFILMGVLIAFLTIFVGRRTSRPTR